jgi:hypothetical protein
MLDAHLAGGGAGEIEIRERWILSKPLDAQSDA